MMCMAAKYIAKTAAHFVWALRRRIFCVPDR